MLYSSGNVLNAGSVSITWLAMKLAVLVPLLVMMLIACNPVAGSTTDFALPNATPTKIQLPYRLVIESAEYCQLPDAYLTVEEGNGLPENELVRKLVESWLMRYKHPDAHPYCRIDDYRIEKVYDDPGMYSNAIEPRGDFLRVVDFSVKLIQVPTNWLSLDGELDPQNWLHLSHIVAITRTATGYTMEFANP